MWDAAKAEIRVKLMHVLEKRKNKTNHLKCHHRKLENEKDLKGIMESKISEAEKDKYQVISLSCGS